MNAALLLTWWNLIFLLPFGLGLLYLVIYSVSGLSFGDALDAEADADAHVDAEAHAEMSAEVHAEGEFHAEPDAEVQTEIVDADADHEAEHEADAHEHDSNSIADVLTWLGLGKAPLTILITVLLITWGLAGFFINLGLWGSMGGWVWIVSVPAAAIISLGVTHLAGRAFARLMPASAGNAPPKTSLVGRVGEALYNIDHKFGLAAVRDPKGELYQVPCRIYPDRPVIPKGDKVLLVDYDTDEKLFYVARSEFSPQH